MHDDILKEIHKHLDVIHEASIFALSKNITHNQDILKITSEIERLLKTIAHSRAMLNMFSHSFLLDFMKKNSITDDFGTRIFFMTQRQIINRIQGASSGTLSRYFLKLSNRNKLFFTSFSKHGSGDMRRNIYVFRITDCKEIYSIGGEIWTKNKNQITYKYWNKKNKVNAEIKAQKNLENG